MQRCMIIPSLQPPDEHHSSTLHALNMVKYWKEQHIICVTGKIIEEHIYEERGVPEASADSGQETLTLIFSHLSPSVIIMHVASRLKVVHEGGYNTHLVSGVRTQAVSTTPRHTRINFFHMQGNHTQNCTCSS